MPDPLLLGHRGVRGPKSARENTLAAFDFALSQGCDGFEFDVRLSSDGEAVICHDATVRNRKIAECSSEQLRLPLLRDVLQRYRDRAFLDIELKVPGLETLTIDLLEAFPPAKGYVISSFLPEVLEKIYRLNAGTKLRTYLRNRIAICGMAGVSGPVHLSSSQVASTGYDRVGEIRRPQDFCLDGELCGRYEAFCSVEC